MSTSDFVTAHRQFLVYNRKELFGILFCFFKTERAVFCGVAQVRLSDLSIHNLFAKNLQVVFEITCYLWAKSGGVLSFGR